MDSRRDSKTHEFLRHLCPYSEQASCLRNEKSSCEPCHKYIVNLIRIYKEEVEKILEGSNEN